MAIDMSNWDIRAETRKTATECGQATPREPATALLQSEVFVNVDFAGGLANRVSALVDRIVGVRPESQGGEKQAGLGGNGLIDTLRSAAAEQRRHLERISEALDRLERDVV